MYKFDSLSVHKACQNSSSVTGSLNVLVVPLLELQGKFSIKYTKHKGVSYNDCA